jgi:hypothetical protein
MGHAGMIGFSSVVLRLSVRAAVVMSITASTPNYPQAYPFESFTLDWFVAVERPQHDEGP